MPLFHITIHGRNFRLNLEGKWEKFGFYTPRFVEAPDSVLAEHAALEDFRQSAKYLDLVARSLNSEDDPPTICGEDIAEVSRQEEEGKKPAGLALYRESDH
jgi:hypothetical protein